MTFRKTLVAWYTCAQETMNRPAFFCGLRIINPYKSIERNESDLLFKIAIKMGSNDYLSYPFFVRVVDSYISFSRFDGVNDDGYLEKSEMMKEIENQNYTYRMNVENCQQAFQVLQKDHMNFGQYFIINL